MLKHPNIIDYYVRTSIGRNGDIQRVLAVNVSNVIANSIEEQEILDQLAVIIEKYLNVDAAEINGILVEL